MKLVFSTRVKRKVGPEYVVSLPNWFNIDNVNSVVDAAKKKIPEKVVDFILYSDASLTINEKNQIDYYGKVTSSPVPLQVEYD